MKSLTIAILFHEKKSSAFHRRRYSIMFCAELWRQRGHKVVILSGTRHFVPADICIVHVDLSVVPEHYLEFANRYPVVVNGEIADIRKSAFSENLLSQDSAYHGEVIVKTDANFAGWPERVLSQPLPSLVLVRALKKLMPQFPAVVNSFDYRVYGALQEVPQEIWDNPDLVVEKFLPEKEGDIYYNNCYMFMGDADFCVRFGSTLPIVKAEFLVSQQVIPVNPEMVRRRHAMKFGFGKFDYAMHNGKPVLYDVNTTFAVTKQKSRRKRAFDHFANSGSIEKLVEQGRRG